MTEWFADSTEYAVSKIGGKVLASNPAARNPLLHPGVERWSRLPNDQDAIEVQADFTDLAATTSPLLRNTLRG